MENFPCESVVPTVFFRTHSYVYIEPSLWSFLVKSPTSIGSQGCGSGCSGRRTSRSACCASCCARRSRASC